MNIIKTLVLALSLAVAGPALATTELNKTIVSMGVQGTTAYISFSPTPAGCLYNLVYIADLNNIGGRSLYAGLLMALASGQPLSRIDFYPNAVQPARCDLNLIEMRP